MHELVQHFDRRLGLKLIRVCPKCQQSVFELNQQLIAKTEKEKSKWKDFFLDRWKFSRRFYVIFDFDLWKFNLSIGSNSSELNTSQTGLLVSLKRSNFVSIQFCSTSFFFSTYVFDIVWKSAEFFEDFVVNSFDFGEVWCNNLIEKQWSNSTFRWISFLLWFCSTHVSSASSNKIFNWSFADSTKKTVDQWVQLLTEHVEGI